MARALAAALKRADTCTQQRLQVLGRTELAPLADPGRGLPLRDLPSVLARCTLKAVLADLRARAATGGAAPFTIATPIIGDDAQEEFYVCF